ncbi:MAG: efflux RND transporter periplasmic adaptor subunit [Gammaproteobacteria bacterium]|nr:efflux RND transporter periplasmic adaptor subunit [Gammaproteobacteria bacterium]
MRQPLHSGRTLSFLAGLASLLFIGAPVAQEAPPSPVRVVTVEQGSLTEVVSLPATVRARRSVTLSPEVEGLVAELLVDEGDRVRAGDVLLRLRETPARLDLRAEQSALNHALAGARLAELKETRFAELLKSQAAAQDSYDIAKAELEQARASAAASRARVGLLRDRLAQHTLKAPFDGIVSTKTAEVGRWLNRGDPALTLVENAVVRVRFALPQQYRQQVRPGTPVEIRFDAFPGRPVNATVSQLVAVADETARTLPGWIEIDTAEPAVTPGMSANIELRLEGADSALLVPRDTLVMSPDGNESVWVVKTEDNQMIAQPLAVTRLRQAGTQVEVRAAGLAAGDTLVIGGNERLRPGQSVVIQP